MKEKKNNVVVDKALCRDGWRCKVMTVMEIHWTVVVNAKNDSIENIIKLALKDLKYPVSDAAWHWQKLIKVVNGWMQSIGYGEINWWISSHCSSYKLRIHHPSSHWSPQYGLDTILSQFLTLFINRIVRFISKFYQSIVMKIICNFQWKESTWCPS